MPVQFLSAEQRQHYGRYAGIPSNEELARYFHLDDTDLEVISAKRGEHNRLGFAVQLSTARFLGTFLEDLSEVPPSVVLTLSRQLLIQDTSILAKYLKARQRLEHIIEIRVRYGFKEWDDPSVGFRLTRWMYALCWTGTERASVLFDRATVWLLSHKVILPGCTTLERYVAKLRNRVETRLWQRLGQGITTEQRKKLENLLSVPPQGRSSWLDKLRTGPTRVSGRSLVATILRLQSVRDLGIKLPKTSVPPSRLASLARFAGTAKVTAIIRLPPVRRLATLVAFIHCLEATAQDDVIEVLDIWLNALFNEAAKADKKARLRSLKDLDKAAMVLAKACRTVLNFEIEEHYLRNVIFTQIPPENLAEALTNVESLVRPPDDIYYTELEKRYLSLRIFVPNLLKHISFGASPAGEPVVAAYEWLKLHEQRIKDKPEAPRDVITKAWRCYVLNSDDTLNIKAYTLCVFDQLRKALRRRDIFVSPSWRFADPRSGLLQGDEWENSRAMICRSLGLSSEPYDTLSALASELDQTYRAVAARLPDNPHVRFEANKDKIELILSPLDSLDEPESLIKLRELVVARMPVVDLPEILLETSTRTKFTDAFTHISERGSRTQDLSTSLCAVLLAEACNIGTKPLVNNEILALKRERLAWVNQNYIRDDTLIAANATLVAAQNQIALAHAWGGGEVASADGLRFVVPVRTVHAGPNPKYFGMDKA